MRTSIAWLALVAGCTGTPAPYRVLLGSDPLRMSAQASWSADGREVVVEVRITNMTDRFLLLQQDQRQEGTPLLEWSLEDDRSTEILEGRDLGWVGQLSYTKMGHGRVEREEGRVHLRVRDGDEVRRTLRLPVPGGAPAPRRVSITTEATFLTSGREPETASLSCSTEIPAK